MPHSKSARMVRNSVGSSLTTNRNQGGGPRKGGSAPSATGFYSLPYRQSSGLGNKNLVFNFQSSHSSTNIGKRGQRNKCCNGQRRQLKMMPDIDNGITDDITDTNDTNDTNVAPKEFRLSPAFVDGCTYNKMLSGNIPVRLSWIFGGIFDSPPDNLIINNITYDWDYKNTYFCAGESTNNLYLNTMLISLSGGSHTVEYPISNDTNSFKIYIPNFKEPIATLWIGDPSIATNEWGVSNAHEVLNASINYYTKDNSDIDPVRLIIWPGDLLYDTTLSVHKTFWGGKCGSTYTQSCTNTSDFTLNTNFYSTMQLITIGNHEYNTNGDAGGQEAGWTRQFLQFWGMDTFTSPWNKRGTRVEVANNIEYCSDYKSADIDWGFYIVGNLGFYVVNVASSTYDDAKVSLNDPMDASQGDNPFVTFYTRASDLGVDTFYVVGHWDTQQDNVTQGIDTPGVMQAIKSDILNSTSTVYNNNISYIVGHTHQNNQQGEDDNWMVGGNGHITGCGCSDAWSCYCVCPSYRDVGGEWHQGWDGVGTPQACKIGWQTNPP
jgi:hypothetical protein